MKTRTRRTKAAAFAKLEAAVRAEEEATARVRESWRLALNRVQAHQPAAIRDVFGTRQPDLERYVAAAEERWNVLVGYLRQQQSRIDQLEARVEELATRFWSIRD